MNVEDSLAHFQPITTSKIHENEHMANKGYVWDIGIQKLDVSAQIEPNKSKKKGQKRWKKGQKGEKGEKGEKRSMDSLAQIPHQNV